MTKIQISINIPTFNSERTLKLCLDSIIMQENVSYEVIIVDCGSNDNGSNIAKEYGVEFFVEKRLRTLGQRRMACEFSSGHFCLLMDSDQVLSRHALSDLMALSKQFNVIVLGERSFKPKSILAKLADLDRLLAQQYYKEQMDPIHGMLVPRFYERKLLLRAFERVPLSLDSSPSGWADALIYHKVSELSDSPPAYLPDSIFHQDRGSISDFIAHYFEFGKQAKSLTSLYPELSKLINSKKNGRMLLFRKELDFKLRLFSFIYMAMKGVPYQLGTCCV